jgi:uncharacterized peroxidase-related enzyme
MKNMGNSPTVLKAYLALAQAAASTNFSPQLREKIALTVGQVNGCQYCLSAHSLLARNAGVAAPDILKAREGFASNPKEQAILKFAKTIVDKKGSVSDQDVQELKKQGVSDKELVELILIVNESIFTNYFNIITGSEVDFPQAPPLKS